MFLQKPSGRLAGRFTFFLKHDTLDSTKEVYVVEIINQNMTEKTIRHFLGNVNVVGSTLLCFDEMDSTNTYLKQLATSGTKDGTVVVADCQTAGRGRLSRQFQSPVGKGIYCSVLLRPIVPLERLSMVTALAGVAVCDAVERVCGVRPGLKWPNDPVLNRRKVCGILTELVSQFGEPPCVILGIGINVLQTETDFSPEVAEMATSLSMELGHPVSRPELTAALIEEIDRLYDTLHSGDLSSYLAAYRKDCINIGKMVQLIQADGGRETVVAVDVDEQFELVVKTEDGTEKTVRTGEVSVRGLYGYVE